MPRRILFNADDALAIANKLEATIEEGRKHQRVHVTLMGTHVGSYGIQRGSRDLPHDYIPKQIRATNREATGLADCSLKLEPFVRILQSRGVLPRDGAG